MRCHSGASITKKNTEIIMEKRSQQKRVSGRRKFFIVGKIAMNCD